MSEEEIPEEEPQIEEPQARIPVRERPREPLVSPEVKDVIDLRKFMEGDKGEKGEKPQLSLMELIMLQDWMDRRDDRKDKKNPTLTAEDISKIVSEKIEAVKPKTEEMPEWAKKMQQTQEDMLKRISEDEQEKRDKKLITEATDPLKTELEKERETRTRLEERVKEIEGKPPSPGEGTDTIKFYVDTKERLEKAGILKELKPGTVYLSQDGAPMPVSGEVPWWFAYGPALAKQTVKGIREEIEGIAASLGLTSSPKTETPPKGEELIHLPPKPEPPKPAEEPKPAEQPVPPQEETPQEPLIKLPEKPKPEEKGLILMPAQPTFTEESLKEMKMTELWAIAAQLAVSKKGKKAELVKRILEAKKDGKENPTESSPQ